MDLDVDEHGRPEPPPAADEETMLLAFLDHHRATLDWKTRGLGAEGLSRKVAASDITLGGLLKHLTWVEDHWFSYYLHGRERSAPWDTVDWAADPDWEWHTAVRDAPDDLRTAWTDAVERSRALVEKALAGGGLDRVAERRWHDGTGISLRWIVVHMIEEYARHNGHADLIREAVDGETGE